MTNYSNCLSVSTKETKQLSNSINQKFLSHTPTIINRNSVLYCFESKVLLTHIQNCTKAWMEKREETIGSMSWGQKVPFNFIYSNECEWSWDDLLNVGYVSCRLKSLATEAIKFWLIWELL